MKPRRKKPAFLAVQNGERLQVVRLDAGPLEPRHALKTLGVGQCMAPVLLPGDRAELRPLSGPPPVGAIVTFRAGERLITHRVVRVEGGRFWARGDNNIATEGPLPLDCILGEVVAFERDGVRHGLSGPWHRWLGLVRSHSLHCLRQFAARHPRLRELVEVDVLSSGPVRILYRIFVDKVFGKVRIEEEKDKIKKLAYVIRTSQIGTDDYLLWLEKKAQRDELFVFRAEFDRFSMPAGYTVFVEFKERNHRRIGLAFGVAVHFGFRGAGIGRLLILAREKKAVERKISTMIVQIRPDNRRSLGLFGGLGYRRLSIEEISALPATVRKRLVPGLVVVGKQLSCAPPGDKGRGADPPLSRLRERGRG